MESGRSRKIGTNSVTIIVRIPEKENKKEVKKSHPSSTQNTEKRDGWRDGV